jgi:hypothetical protein
MLRFYPHRQARIMRLEPYREAWNLILPRKSNHVMEIKACADERYSNPCHSDRREESAFGLQHPDADPDLVIYRDLIRRTPATTVQQSLAAWPIPPLKILMTREGKRLLEKI